MVNGFLHIDVGQCLIAFLLFTLTMTGRLIKYEIGQLVTRLEKNEEVVRSLVERLSVVTGEVSILAKVVSNIVSQLGIRRIRKTDLDLG